MRFGPGVDLIEDTYDGVTCDFGGRPRFAPGRLDATIFCMFGAIELVAMELVCRACWMRLHNRKVESVRARPW